MQIRQEWDFLKQSLTFNPGSVNLTHPICVRLFMIIWVQMPTRLSHLSRGCYAVFVKDKNVKALVDSLICDLCNNPFHQQQQHFLLFYFINQTHLIDVLTIQPGHPFNFGGAGRSRINRERFNQFEYQFALFEC